MPNFQKKLPKMRFNFSFLKTSQKKFIPSSEVFNAMRKLNCSLS